MQNLAYPFNGKGDTYSFMAYMEPFDLHLNQNDTDIDVLLLIQKWNFDINIACELFL